MNNPNLPYEELFEAIRAFASAGSEVPLENVIEAFDNRPAEKMPKGDYCTVAMGDLVAYGKPITKNKRVEEQVEKTVIQNKSFVCKLFFFRGLAFEYASKMQGCYRLETVQKILRDNRLGLRAVRNAIRLPKVKSFNYEERAVVELEFFIQHSRVELVDQIDKVKIVVNNEHGEIYPPKEPEIKPDYNQKDYKVGDYG